MTRKIKTIKALKLALKDGDYHQFFIALAGGVVRSSKDIAYCPENDTFQVTNFIDDTEQEDLTAEDLMNKKITNIGEAIKKGAFHAY